MIRVATRLEQRSTDEHRKVRISTDEQSVARLRKSAPVMWKRVAGDYCSKTRYDLRRVDFRSVAQHIEVEKACAPVMWKRVAGDFDPSSD